MLSVFPLNSTPEGSFVHPRDPGEVCYGGGAPRVSVTVEEARILSWFARNRVVLEIGTGLGVSTRALAEGAQYVLTVDNDPWVQSTIWPSFVDCPNITTYEEVPNIPRARADLFFIDGDHSPEGLRRDINRVMPLASGLLIFHDVSSSRVREVVLEAFPEMRTIDTAHGLGLVWLDS